MKQICFLFFFFTLTLQAQFQVNGIVKDGSSNKALPFATLTTDDGLQFVSDVDGKFNIKTKKAFSQLFISYIGYQSNSILISQNNSYTIVSLLQKENNLNEVVVGHENPALAIIRQVIANKHHNNPQEKLSSFEFKSYNKLVVTANPDSISERVDSVFVSNADREFVKIDSSNYKFKELINKQHLFQTEKVSQVQYSNKALKEIILGTKMAGFKQPIYEVLGFNLQSFSIYDDSYELFETKYNSPIAYDAFKDYNFTILDTVAVKGRQSYMIYFKNKKKSKAAGLEGVLYIDQLTFAISKAIMRIKGILDISGIHEFQFLPEENIWFPIQKTFKIVKGKNDDDIKILGGTIQFDGDDAPDFKTRKKTVTDYSYLLSNTTNFDLKYNNPLIIKKPFIAVEIDEKAIHRPERFWETFRKDSLDSRSQKTYLALDSIVIKKRIESRLRFGRKIINGYLPLSFFDMDLRKIFSYNNYEGFRLGFGGVTNDRFSKSFKIEGYSAYGTKDGTFKYNLGLSTRVDKTSNSWIGAAYTDDVKEIASTSYAIEKRPFKIYDPRPINISTFYNYVSWSTFLETQLVPKTESIWELAHTVVEPKFNYSFNVNGNLYTNYTMTTAKVSLKWSPFSDYMQTPTGRIEIEKRFPKFAFQYTQTLPKITNNDFEYSKFDFKTEYEKKYLNGQKTSLLLEAGLAIGDVPLTHLYNTAPNNITKETVVQRITFAGKKSFETMYFNEFFSTEFVYFQFKHGFKRVRLFDKVKPSLVLVSRMAWGNMKKPEQHIGLEYKTLDKGYLESGIELNQIYNGLGLTAFYRYGPNQLPKFEDNIAIKLSFVLNLGL
ncbi:DUF5686 family protein [Flavobacterium muglaense]|uniref:Carboxypeptidase-like regulatory domain-containing protein n=1 Tax=Flavobacterium muglaense TaxID=2764716 RepID=A0A923N0X3_9FLAO|nr:DUF5686 family protein [Flavobacterium muglaense]MBC5838449.1 carboxypeptidase-like regulatory domain-containing protein [Flavobacterium muglaense]MBC5844997.1 carboxypeptidase-like regulatory domain-containing protein [Flavobacterium muglaense]